MLTSKIERVVRPLFGFEDLFTKSLLNRLRGELLVGSESQSMVVGLKGERQQVLHRLVQRGRSQFDMLSLLDNKYRYGVSRNHTKGA